MKGKIFRQVFTAVMAFFLLCCAVFSFTFYRYIGDDYARRLRENAAHLAGYVTQNGGAGLDTVAQAVGEQVIWISPNGQILFDSENAGLAGTAYPGSPETEEAFRTGSGEDRRRDPAGVYLCCVAQRAEDGSVVRVAAAAYSPMAVFTNLFIPFFVGLALAMVLSALLALWVSRSVIQPINNIDLNGPDERDVYPELQPLVRRINGQSRQIRRQMQELREEHSRQDTLRREFTANVSHELKTPLTSISGYAELMRDGVAKPEDTRRFSGRIYDECQRLITLVGDILKLSRMESGLQMPPLRPLDLYALCTTVAGHLENAAAQASVKLTLTGEPAKVDGAESVLYEMVYNLCDNAIKYNRSDGAVALTVENTADGAVLRVKDTGIGIPPEDIDRVFERFYRVDKSHSKEVGGTGLGLSIVKHGAAYHRATVAVTSVLNEGTEVTLRFPPTADGSEAQTGA